MKTGQSHDNISCHMIRSATLVGPDTIRSSPHQVVLTKWRETAQDKCTRSYQKFLHVTVIIQLPPVHNCVEQDKSGVN